MSHSLATNKQVLTCVNGALANKLVELESNYKTLCYTN